MHCKAIHMSLMAFFLFTGCRSTREAASANWELFMPYVDAGRDAMDSQEFEAAAENYIIANGLVEETEGGTAFHDSLAYVYGFQGKYDLAISASMEEIAIAEKQKSIHLTEWQRVSKLLRSYFDHHLKVGDFYLAKGEFSLALQHYKEAKSYYRQYEEREPQNRSPIKTFSELGNYYLQIGEYSNSRTYFETVKKFLDQKRFRDQALCGAITDIGLACYYDGDYAPAEQLFKEAIGIDGLVVFPEDLALAYVMLGKTYEKQGHPEKALKPMESALKFLEDYGRLRTLKIENSDVLYEIGEFRLRQGDIEDAHGLFEAAIQLRHDTGTQTHPNCADAMKGVACVDAATGKFAAACDQERAALAVLDEALVPTHPRIAHHLVALAALERLNGNGEAAAAVDERLDSILEKPLGPWKEDFLETAKFYASLLQENGKSQDAERLNRISE